MSYSIKCRVKKVYGNDRNFRDEFDGGGSCVRMVVEGSDCVHVHAARP